MFEFLEREGAQVLVEPIATWVAYMLYQVQLNGANRKAIDAPYRNPAGGSSISAQERVEVPLEVARHW